MTPIGEIRFSDDPEEHNRKAAEYVRASRSFDELFRRFVAEEEARLLRLALQCFAKAVTDRKSDPPPPPTLFGSLDDLVSSLHPDAEGLTLRVSRAAFERITYAGQIELRNRGAATVDHSYSEPKSGLLVAYYNGVRIEAEP